MSYNVYNLKNLSTLEGKTPIVTKKQAASFIRDQREQRGMSRQDLAEMAGVSVSAIDQFERELKGSPALMDALAQALGYRLDVSYNFTPIEK